jgi:S1/P1 Nuclease
MVIKAVCALVMAALVISGVTPAYGWDSFGHMMAAYVAYQQLTQQTKVRANALVQMNPKHAEWLGWVPASASPATRDMMVFMIAATWPDEIKGDAAYVSDGSQNGNRPEGSPDPSGNHGYGDMLRHKYWHFVDTPFSSDRTALPPIPTPNAQDRITLFRGVLNSSAPDALKSYDLVWLLHLVGDVHQPLHCATRASSAEPGGDSGGNTVKVSCAGCPTNLHAFWDNAVGTATTVQLAIDPVIKAAKKLPTAAPTQAAKADAQDWVAESFQAAQQAVYRSPIKAGNGPFPLTSAYEKAAAKLARQRVALAGARLARLLNNELK